MYRKDRDTIMFENVKTFDCECGKPHQFTSKVVVGEGVIRQLPELLSEYQIKKPFVVADETTYQAAGKEVVELLKENKITAETYIFHQDVLEPDEASVGLVAMNFNPECDAVIGVGSGVINDICKILANVTGKPYIIVATAPSMDGYASSTSSMIMEGLKISLNSKCADVIIGDTDILCHAPEKMLLSGLGDMLAKYISIFEWRLSRLITGEYYCDDIAKLVKDALKKCVDNAEGLLERKKEAVTAVFEGLVICGAGMKFAGLSRPASGVEHYFSHVWDMRSVEFGTPVETHGIACAVGTLIAIQMYEKLKGITPNREKAIKSVEAFDFEAWSQELRKFFGKAAESMIALEEKEQKYNTEKHKARLQIIIDNWDTILQMIKTELPSYEELKQLYEKMGIPTTVTQIGLEEEILPMTFKSTKDIRDKYVLSRLCWDLGISDEIL